MELSLSTAQHLIDFDVRDTVECVQRSRSKYNRRRPWTSPPVAETRSYGRREISDGSKLTEGLSPPPSSVATAEVFVEAGARFGAQDVPRGIASSSTGCSAAISARAHFEDSDQQNFHRSRAQLLIAEVLISMWGSCMGSIGDRIAGLARRFPG